MVSINYKEYEISLYCDGQYDPASADNSNSYNAVYYSKSTGEYISSRISVVIKLGDEIAAGVILFSGGGFAGIHEKSYVLKDDAIYICAGNSLFSLSLPDLKLRWVTEVDWGSAFKILEISDGFIIHGELSISRVDKDGNILWQNSGPDIFVSPLGERDCCFIRDDTVYAETWDGSTFRFDFDGHTL